MKQLNRGIHYVDVYRVQKHLITKLKYWSGGMLLIVILGHVIMGLVDNRFCFFWSIFHSIIKL